MKRAISAKPQLPAAPKENKLRICTLPDCGRPLQKKSQKLFCSKTCRAKGLGLSNKDNAETKYKPEYSTTLFDAYMAKIKKGNEPTLIPTESSYILIHNADVPTMEDYADFLGFHPNTLEKWSKAYMEFAVILDRLFRIQKQMILNNGLAGRYNSTIAKLALNVNHGMVEKSQVDNTHKLIGVVKHVYGRADEMEKINDGPKK